MLPKYYLFLILVILTSYATKATENSVAETNITDIKLNEDIAFPKAEFSGMDWYGNKLILLPQYPDRFPSKYNGCLFAITKNEIKAYLKNKNDNSIIHEKIEFDSKNIEDKIKGFQGYESIVFNNNDVYLSIEAENSGQMYSYIIKGEIDSITNTITLLLKSLKEIPLPVNLENMAIETLVIYKDRIIAIYETNGKNVNIDPRAVSFDLALKSYRSFSFPNIEYRITDATRVDKSNSFWAINYLYDGDIDLLKPGFDNIFNKFGKGISHTKSKAVERLVKFKITKNRIVLEDEAPLQLKQTLNNDSRNWEGIVNLDSLGFLVITDRYPRTILAYIPNSLWVNDLSVFERSGKFGFKNALGIEIINPQFSFAQNFSQKGIAAVVDDSGWVCINKNGEKIIRPHVVDNGPDYFSFGLARFKKNNKYGYFDETGKVIIKPQFDYARPFSDSVAAVCKGCRLKKIEKHIEISNGKWGFINLKGEMVIPTIYDKVDDFINGYANVKENGNLLIITRFK